MFKIPLPELKEKILRSGKLNSMELEARIKTKINELSGLISEEGAAHIIANELGIELINLSQQKLKVKEIYPGMRNVSCVGKVMRKFELREFAKGDKTGKVCSILLGDETGTLRVVFWNDQVNLIQQFQEDDVLLIRDGYIKDNKGSKEFHLSEKSIIQVNPENEKITMVRSTFNTGRKKISEIAAGEEGVELLCTVVQVFDPRFFPICSSCSKRVLENAGNYQCVEHGVIQPIHSYVLNLVLDDGSGTIRGVFWKNQTTQLLGKEEQEIVKYRENMPTFEDVKTDLLGEQLKVIGRVQRNEMFDRLELNVQVVEKAKPEEELARLKNGS